MKYTLIIMASLLALTACNSTDNSSYNLGQGVKLEDAHKGDMMHDSPLPNGSPDTLPSEMSASPTGQSMGAPLP
jgi:hypothetical protein